MSLVKKDKRKMSTREDATLLIKWAPLLDAADITDMNERLTACGYFENILNRKGFEHDDIVKNKIHVGDILVPLFARFLHVFSKNGTYEEAAELVRKLKSKRIRDEIKKVVFEK